MALAFEVYFGTESNLRPPAMLVRNLASTEVGTSRKPADAKEAG